MISKAFVTSFDGLDPANEAQTIDEMVGTKFEKNGFELN
jgi:hypothetical protein